MKTTLMLFAAVCCIGQVAIMASAQDQPKNEVNKVEKDRQTDHTVKQVTPDPKKSPGKHADNLSKNVNHETNRSSKDFNHTIKKNTTSLHKTRKTDHTVKQVTPDPKKSPGKHADNLSKNVNHETNRSSKKVNKAVNNA